MDEATDYLDETIQKEAAQMEAADGVKRCDFECDGVAETGPPTVHRRE